jgi:hypothetical protein
VQRKRGGRANWHWDRRQAAHLRRRVLRQGPEAVTGVMNKVAWRGAPTLHSPFCQTQRTRVVCLFTESSARERPSQQQRAVFKASVQRSAFLPRRQACILPRSQEPLQPAVGSGRPAATCRAGRHAALREAPCAEQRALSGAGHATDPSAPTTPHAHETRHKLDHLPGRPNGLDRTHLLICIPACRVYLKATWEARAQCRSLRAGTPPPS